MVITYVRKTVSYASPAVMKSENMDESQLGEFRAVQGNTRQYQEFFKKCFTYSHFPLFAHVIYNGGERLSRRHSLCL